MISIDYRNGSGELAPLFRPKNIATENIELPAGDFAFNGKGPDGSTLFIGVERKELKDALNSIRHGRLSAQVINMYHMFNRSYVIIEGIYRCGYSGVIETKQFNVRTRKYEWAPLYIGQQAFMFSMLDRYMISIEETYRGNVRFHRTSSKEETAERVANMFIEWQKEYESRHSWDAVPDPHPVEVTPWSDTRRLMERLPGIGEKGSKSMEKQWGSMRALVAATVEEIAETMLATKTGNRRLGLSAATKIYNALRGKK